jgi:hypothetical protein
VSVWTLFRRNVFPVAPEQNALYFIADPENSALCDAYVSGDLGHVRRVVGARRFDYVQAAPSTAWVINHNLGYTVSVAVYSVGGVELEAEIVTVSPNQIQVLFTTATAGSAVIT